MSSPSLPGRSNLQMLKGGICARGLDSPCRLQRRIARFAFWYPPRSFVHGSTLVLVIASGRENMPWIVDERWEADERPEPRSLGLLPSGSDPVGEWLVHRQPPPLYRALRRRRQAKPVAYARTLMRYKRNGDAQTVPDIRDRNLNRNTCSTSNFKRKHPHWGVAALRSPPH